MPTFEEYLRLGLNPTDNTSDTPDYYNLAVSGYIWATISPPSGIGFDNDAMVVRLLSLEMNDITINTAERVGIGGLKHIVATNIELSHSFTMRFQEDQNATVLKNLIKWVDVIRRIHGGYQALAGEGYKGHVDLLITNPDKSEYFAIRFAGAFPTTVPLSGLQTDVTNNALIELTTTFYFDKMFKLDVAQNQVLNTISTSTVAGFLPGGSSNQGNE